MIEIYDNLFVGSEIDFHLAHNKIGWAIVQACKEPFHRDALGYKTLGAPKDDPEYLVAKRGMRLILNLIDTAEHKYIADELLDAALSFAHENILAGNKVLIHCNLGVSRAPSLGLLYLITYTDFVGDISLFETVEAKYKAIYPNYNPFGIREKVRERFEQLKK